MRKAMFVMSIILSFALILNPAFSLGQANKKNDNGSEWVKFLKKYPLTAASASLVLAGEVVFGTVANGAKGAVNDFMFFRSAQSTISASRLDKMIKALNLAQKFKILSPKGSVFLKELIANKGTELSEQTVMDIAARHNLAGKGFSVITKKIGIGFWLGPIGAAIVAVGEIMLKGSKTANDGLALDIPEHYKAYACDSMEPFRQQMYNSLLQEKNKRLERIYDDLKIDYLALCSGRQPSDNPELDTILGLTDPEMFAYKFMINKILTERGKDRATNIAELELEYLENPKAVACSVEKANNVCEIMGDIESSSNASIL